MQVSLFNDQLLLTVPNNTKYITFPRTPETSQLCRDSECTNTSVLTDLQYAYTSINVTGPQQCWNTSKPHNGCYDASDEVLDFLEYSKNPKPEYW